MTVTYDVSPEEYFNREREKLVKSRENILLNMDVVEPALKRDSIKTWFCFVAIFVCLMFVTICLSLVFKFPWWFNLIVVIITVLANSLSTVLCMRHYTKQLNADLAHNNSVNADITRIRLYTNEEIISNVFASNEAKQNFLTQVLSLEKLSTYRIIGKSLSEDGITFLCKDENEENCSISFTQNFKRLVSADITEESFELKNGEFIYTQLEEKE